VWSRESLHYAKRQVVRVLSREANEYVCEARQEVDMPRMLSDYRGEDAVAFLFIQKKAQ